MRFSLFAVSAVIGAASTATAFVPPQFSNVRSTTSSFFMSATIDEKETITKTAPNAGWEPEWENRNDGLSPTEFMQSDMNKPDLSGMWECPLTRWDSEGYVYFRTLTYHDYTISSNVADRNC
jgi:hypothetical protein